MEEPQQRLNIQRLKSRKSHNSKALLLLKLVETSSRNRFQWQSQMIVRYWRALNFTKIVWWGLLTVQVEQSWQLPLKTRQYRSWKLLWYPTSSTSLLCKVTMVRLRVLVFRQTISSCSAPLQTNHALFGTPSTAKRGKSFWL